MRGLIHCAIAALMCAGTALGQCPLTFEGADEALIGVYVAPVNGGKPLVDYNSAKLFTPASVMKSVTTAAALSKYGGNYRWQTTVMAIGSIEHGVLNGNIVIRGSGDPTLGSTYFKDRESFLDAVKTGLMSAGITKVTGKVLQEGNGWPNEGPIPSWELEDIPGPDGAGFYTLNFSDNVFILSYPSLKTRPEIPGLSIKYLGGSGGLWFNRYPGSYDIRVYGQLAKKQKQASFICSMPNPPAVLLSYMSKGLSVAGEEVNASADTIVLATYRSPALQDVARSLMIRSDNQMAEATLRLMAPGKTRVAALSEERNSLAAAGVNLKNARLRDGSGLSRHNAISPKQLADVLSAMAGNGSYVGSYARVGLDGSTVRNFMKGVPGRENFVLKSGSMTGVVCYVGYRLDPKSKAPTHVISIMVNNAPNPAKARAAMETLLAGLKY